MSLPSFSLLQGQLPKSSLRPTSPAESCPDSLSGFISTRLCYSYSSLSFTPLFFHILQCSSLHPALRLPLLLNASPKPWHSQLNNHFLRKVHSAIHLGQVKYHGYCILFSSIIITVPIVCLYVYYLAFPVLDIPPLKYTIISYHTRFVRWGPWRSCFLLDLHPQEQAILHNTTIS